MKYIARKKNVEYRIDETDISRFLAQGCTIFVDDGNGFRVYKAPAGKEDLQNKVKNLEAVIADLRNQVTLKDSQIISLTSENTALKKENQQLKAEQAVAADAAAKKGSGKKG